MNEIQILQKQLEDLQREVGLLKADLARTKEFQDTFSGKQIINHEVQFLKKVRNKAGNVVTQINP